MRKMMNYAIGMLLIATMLSSCNQQENESVNSLLSNAEKQDEIMTAISSDHNMMENMMGHIMQNEHAMQMMQMNEGMMQKMMKGDHLMGMMKGNKEMMASMMEKMVGMADADSSLCKQMTGMMMEHPNMMKMMKEMMNSTN